MCECAGLAALHNVLKFRVHAGFQRWRCPETQSSQGTQPQLILSLKILLLDISDGTVGNSSSANGGDTGVIPGLGRSHMPRGNQIHEPHLLSLCSRAQEPQLLKPACPRARAPKQEKPLQ